MYQLSTSQIHTPNKWGGAYGESNLLLTFPLALSSVSPAVSGNKRQGGSVLAGWHTNLSNYLCNSKKWTLQVYAN